jgi:hypothetical protein
MRNMALCSLLVVGFVGGCTVGSDEPDPTPVDTSDVEVLTQEAKPCRTNCPPPPKHCMVDANGLETGRCIWHTDTMCAYSVATTGTGCTAGRAAGTVTSTSCGRVSETSCNAGTWLL